MLGECVVCVRHQEDSGVSERVCVCMCARVDACTCVGVCCECATQTLAASPRLAGMMGSCSRNNGEQWNTKVENCKDSCLADLVLSGLSTQYQIYLTKFIIYFDDTITWYFG